VFDESDSPANTRDDITSISEVAITIYQLRSLEDLSKLAKFESAYRCHIAPQAFYKEHKSDVCQTTSCMGPTCSTSSDGKRRPAYASLSWGVLPRLKIQYDKTGPVRYHLIHFVVTFDDPEVARAMDGRWREGSSVIDDPSFRTGTSTPPMSRIPSATWPLKQKETEVRWAMPDDFVG
jgi:hypothetical protein